MQLLLSIYLALGSDFELNCWSIGLEAQLNIQLFNQVNECRSVLLKQLKSGGLKHHTLGTNASYSLCKLSMMFS